jgi:putative ABC transport system permease protein
VLRQGLAIASIGVTAGVIFGIVFARGIGRFVAQVHLPGMPALLLSAFVILAAAVIASAVPAARAARVNAVEALRAE